MRQHARTLLVVAIAVSLAGCGGGGDGTPTPTTGGSSPPATGPPTSPTTEPTAGSDRAAQKILRRARVTALTYYPNHAKTYSEFSAAYANELEPDIAFNTGPSVAGQVTIREVTPDTILFTTIGASGNPLCIGELEGRAGDTSMGLVDAATLSACTGGWPET